MSQESYNEGYRDGENSATVDWMMGLWDELLEGHGFASHLDVTIDKVRALLKSLLPPPDAVEDA